MVRSSTTTATGASPASPRASSPNPSPSSPRTALAPSPTETPLPDPSVIEAAFSRYLAELGTVPEAKRKAYSKLALSDKWRLVLRAQAERQGGATLTAKEAVATLSHANKATVPFMRRLRRVMAGEAEEGEGEGRRQWLHDFLAAQGHYYLMALWKQEILVHPPPSTLPHPTRRCGRG